MSSIKRITVDCKGYLNACHENLMLFANHTVSYEEYKVSLKMLDEVWGLYEY